MDQFETPFLSIPSALILSSSAHFYLKSGICSLMNKKRVTGVFAAGIILSGFLIFMEFSTMDELIESKTVDRTMLDKYINQLNENRTALSGLGTSTKWSKIELRRQLMDNIESITKDKEKEEILVKERQAVSNAKSEKFKAFSLVLLTLSMLTLSSNKDQYNGLEQGETRIYKEKTKIVDKDIDRIIGKEVSNPFKDLPADQRILLASNYLKDNPKASQQLLTSKFSINPPQTKKARKLAKEGGGFEGSENKRYVGFQIKSEK
ncbi:hypothetical protein AVL50_32050 [Flammeovirga sp. SJP92]|nr:hypothetical protein AVL50_32050 [Flammeovirga sp. SJP92]